MKEPKFNIVHLESDKVHLKIKWVIFMDFNSIYFHDSELKEVKYEWHSHTLVFKLNMFHTGPSKPSRQSLLRFLDCTNFELSHNAPWGDSMYVNGAIQIAHKESNEYEIEMISGDILKIRAKTFEIITE